MKVMTGCSSAFINRNVREISPEELAIELQTDRSLHEVIDKNAPVRLYFDVDKDLRPIFNFIRRNRHISLMTSVLQTLNRIFHTSDSDWAISNGSRNGKESYHFISKKYYCTISELEAIYTKNTIPYADKSIIITKRDMSLRLPNQSKYVDGRRVAGPAQIKQGEICDFFITNIEGLTHWPVV